MRHLRWLIALWLVGYCVTAFAQWRENGRPVADTEWRKGWAVYGIEEKAALWSGMPPPSEGELQLSVAAIGVRIEPQDPKGTYQVRARIRDNVSHATVELTRTFRVDP